MNLLIVYTKSNNKTILKLHRRISHPAEMEFIRKTLRYTSIAEKENTVFRKPDHFHFTCCSLIVYSFAGISLKCMIINRKLSFHHQLSAIVLIRPLIRLTEEITALLDL